MNCKKGDLAIITRKAPLEPRSLGAIVEIVRRGLDMKFPQLEGLHPSWEVQSKTPLVMHNGVVSQYFIVPDAFLRPIRDSDGEDEMLCIAGKPEKVTA